MQHQWQRQGVGETRATNATGVEIATESVVVHGWAGVVCAVAGMDDGVVAMAGSTASGEAFWEP